MRYVYLLQYRSAMDHGRRNGPDSFETHSEHDGPGEAFRALREVPRAEYEWRDWQVVVQERAP